MRIGVDYYPEHWDSALWEADAALMEKTGVTLARVGEFAWSRMERAEGVYDFEWLDRAIETLARHGVAVVLGTPTSCPPLWMYRKYPEMAQMDRQGRRLALGIRGHRCYTSPILLEKARALVRAMALHYRGNPWVLAWQIDNEVDADFCTCPSCTAAFRDFVREKYGTIGHVNAAWHTDVWSGTYSDFDQITPPLGDYPLHQFNPAYMLDFRRHASRATVRFVEAQAEWIREILPEAKITTNTWFCEHMPDNRDLYRKLDFVSYDNYPATDADAPDRSHAFHLDFMRGLKQKPFWIMEQLSGIPGCWMEAGRAPRPGMLRGYALQAFAHGADTVVFFRWRSARGGAEQFWGGLIDQWDRPGRRFEEFASLCALAPGLKEIDGTPLDAPAAIVVRFDDLYAFDGQLQAPGEYGLEQARLWHAALTRFGVNVDVIGPEAPLEGYRIVILPTQYIGNTALVSRVRAFCEAGGTALLTCRSGVKDENNNCTDRPLPGPWAELAGVWVKECDPLGRAMGQVRMDGETYGITRWADLPEVRDASPLAFYAGCFYAGTPALTVRACGRGAFYYAACTGTPELTRAVARRLLRAQGLPCAPLPENVECVERGRGDRRYALLYNNQDRAVSFAFRQREVTLAPYEMRVLSPEGEAR